MRQNESVDLYSVSPENPPNTLKRYKNGMKSNRHQYFARGIVKNAYVSVVVGNGILMWQLGMADQ